jgi:hypothetical protein
MQARFLLGVLVPALLAATSASAGDNAACLDAASRGQTLRDARKFVEAREQFLVCAASTCPAAVRADCVTWLTEVDKALPSVVITAKDASGADVVDVTVAVDGRPLASKLDADDVRDLPLGVHGNR